MGVVRRLGIVAPILLLNIVVFQSCDLIGESAFDPLPTPTPTPTPSTVAGRTPQLIVEGGLVEDWNYCNEFGPIYPLVDPDPRELPALFAEEIAEFASRFIAGLNKYDQAVVDCTVNENVKVAILTDLLEAQRVRGQFAFVAINPVGSQASGYGVTAKGSLRTSSYVCPVQVTWDVNKFYNASDPQPSIRAANEYGVRLASWDISRYEYLFEDRSCR